MTEQATPSMDQLARVYLKIRTRISERTQVFDTEIEGLKAQQTEIAHAMKDIMQAAGLKSAKTEHGTVMLTTKTRYVAQDWDAFKRFVIDNDAADLFEKRIAQKNMGEFLENNPGVVPPGLNTMSEVDVSVRKAT
jgi:hypothetical protein